jgi:hypothetical protein
VKELLTLGRRTLRIWVFVADITDEFIMGLDIMLAARYFTVAYIIFHGI